MINLKTSKAFFKRFALYCIIGTACSTLDAVIFTWIVNRYPIDAIVANLISAPVGLTASFFLNSIINFKKTDRLLKRALTFYGVGLCGLVLSTAVIAVGEHLGYTIETVKLFAIAAAGALQFILNTFITFKK